MVPGDCCFYVCCVMFISIEKKVASKCLNVCEQVEVVERNNNDGFLLPHLSPYVPVNGSACERKPDTKHK